VAHRSDGARESGLTRTTRRLAAAVERRSLDLRSPDRLAGGAKTGNRWTFEHHYRALLDVFGEVRDEGAA